MKKTVSVVLMLATWMLGCRTPAPSASSRPVVVLVHGAFADHHAFDAVKPLLEAKGYSVVTPDLPGHGEDSTPLSEITLDRYTDSVLTEVRSHPQGVVLVGHSMAGMVVAQVAERAPQQIKQVVFVCAYLPQNGQSLQDLASTDAESVVGKSLQFAPDYRTATLAKERVVEALAADLPTPLQRVIVNAQRPEPLAPFQGKVTLTDAGFGQVRKAYLFTSQDRAVTLGLQRRMASAYPQLRTTTLTTGHLPFLAQPQPFADALIDLITHP